MLHHCLYEIFSTRTSVAAIIFVSLQQISRLGKKTVAGKMDHTMQVKAVNVLPTRKATESHTFFQL